MKSMNRDSLSPQNENVRFVQSRRIHDESTATLPGFRPMFSVPDYRNSTNISSKRNCVPPSEHFSQTVKLRPVAVRLWRF
jgi:hypothetical protein